MTVQTNKTNAELISSKDYLGWYLRHPEVLPPDAAGILGITRQHAWRVRRKAIEALSHKKGPGAKRRKQEVLDEFESKSLKQIAPSFEDSVASVLQRAKPRLSENSYRMLAFVLSAPKPVHLSEITAHTGVAYRTTCSWCARMARMGYIAPMGRGIYWKPEPLQPEKRAEFEAWKQSQA